MSWIASRIAPKDTYGVDINQKALDRLRENVHGVNALLSPARELPFRDGWFDLVFTMGVLIQQFTERFKSGWIIFELMMILGRIHHIEDIF